jgi:hypothetical protein
MKMANYHAIQVSRAFEAVKQQLLGLDVRWLEDAVGSAAELGEASLGDAGVRATDAALHVRVQVGRPYVGRLVFALPMEWEVKGSVLPLALRGELNCSRWAQPKFSSV